MTVRDFFTAAPFWGLRPQVFPPAVYHDQRGVAASNFNSRQDIPLELSKENKDQVTIDSNKDVRVQFKGNGRGPLTKDPQPTKGYKPKKNKLFDAGKVRGKAGKRTYSYSVIYVEPNSKPDPNYVYTLDPRFWVN